MTASEVYALKPGRSPALSRLGSSAVLQTWVAAIVLLREAFGGALRYYFAILNVGYIWFVFDLILVAVLLLAIPRFLQRNATGGLVLAWIVVAITFSAFVGISRGSSVLGVLAGTKIYLPFVAMLIAYDPNADMTALRRISVSFLVVLTASVLFDLYNDFPWKGFAFEQIGVRRVAARDWTILGQERIAGASQASFAASLTAGALAMVAVKTTNHWRTTAFCIALAMVVAFVTTSRSAQLALLLVVIVGAVAWKRRDYAYWKAGPDLKIIFIVVAVAACAIPFYYALIGQQTLQAYRSSFASSLIDRAWVMWPAAGDRLNAHAPTSYFWGLGTGLFGTGAIYQSSRDLLSAVDNTFLYLFSQFGLFAVVLAYMFARAALSADLRSLLIATFAVATGAFVNFESAPVQILYVIVLAEAWRSAANRRPLASAARSPDRLLMKG